MSTVDTRRRLDELEREINLLHNQLTRLASHFDAFGTCDWGNCDEDGAGLRWHDGDWLAVCFSHRTPFAAVRAAAAGPGADGGDA